jgi:hypothetical protein
MPDGVLGDDQTPSPALTEAVADGLLLDIGYGINFSYATARPRNVAFVSGLMEAKVDFIAVDNPYATRFTSLPPSPSMNAR